MAEARTNNTPIEIQEYTTHLKRSRETILLRTKAEVAKAETTNNKRILKPGIAIQDLEIALLYRAAMVGVDVTRKKCQQLQVSINQAISEGKPQEEIDGLKTQYFSKVKELNKRCKLFNDWNRGTPDPTGGATYREIAEDTIIQLLSQLIKEMNGDKKRDSGFPDFPLDERDTRVTHYREYFELYKALETAIRTRKKQKEDISNGNSVSKDAIKNAKEAVRVAKEQFMGFGRQRRDVLRPALSMYGEIRDTEEILLTSKIGKLCRVRNSSGQSRGPLVDADMFEAVIELLREARKIDQKIKDERRQNNEIGNS